ncbi:hypothetical protein [Corallincola spongiicola]|uniref:Polysaccharide lyase n=1 Tax=Corallincola spongiicola TaxID=2520508 RepID=A0ABY1WMS5_9GAMM|nr:hypothetical protein [Corallincola spongiicola]TAA43723.1 hypothetical protein EXY25_14355 [Corallincola spongiicola]
MKIERRWVAVNALILMLSGLAIGGVYVAIKTDNCRQQDAIWCTDFENNAGLKEWKKGEQDNNAKIVTFPGPIGSPQQNQVLQLSLPPGKGGTGLNRKLTKDYQQLHLRWFILYQTGFDFSARFHGQGLMATQSRGKAGFRPKGNDWFSVKVDHGINLASGLPAPYLYAYYPGMSMDCRDPNGKCWGDRLPCFIDQRRYCRDPSYRPAPGLPQLTTNQWYCVELMVDLGTPTPSTNGANGRMNLSIDGQSLGPWQNLWLRSSDELKLDRVAMGFYHHGQHSEAGILIDNIVLSEQPIGCSL